MKLPVANSKPWVIAHRGNSSVAPENTLAAFQAALEVGADMVELDVHLSADGRVIVMHDDDVTRTTNGQGKIRDLSWPQIQKLDAGGWFNQRFQGEPVPTLDETLRLLSGNAKACIELKDNDPRLAGEVLRLLDQTDMREHSLIVSFHEKVLRGRHDWPNRPLLSLISTRPGCIDRACAIGADGVQPIYNIVDVDFLDRLHKAKLFAAVWTVDDLSMMRKMVDLGVDGITSNAPGILLDLLGRNHGHVSGHTNT